jgi:hypothetical protein
MTVRKFQLDSESDDSIVLQYESLRWQVLNRYGDFSEPALGLTLFIRRGMLAWIDVCHKCMPVDSSRQKQTKPSVFAYGVTSEMVKVMANITLSNLEEAL